MKFTLKKSSKFGWRGLKGWAYSSEEDFKNASAAYFEVTGRHGKVKTKKSDRVYYCQEAIVLKLSKSQLEDVLRFAYCA